MPRLLLLVPLAGVLWETVMIDRKQAIRDFKEAVVPRGIFAVTCAASGEKWVGLSRNLNAQKNGLWFQLGVGSFRTASLQKAWKTHGEASFAFEVVEELPEDTAELVLHDVLKERRGAWAAELGLRRFVERALCA